MRLSDHATRLGASLLLLGTVPLAVGCADAQPGGGEPIGSAEQAIFGNDQTSFDYFVAKGLTPVQAAGIVGNLDQESGDSPTAVQSGGPGRGVAQWSVGGRWDTSSGDNENAFVGASKIWDLTAQLDFIWYELTTFPGYGLADLKTQTTISGATTSFMTLFEICGTCDATNRIAYAQAVYDAYGNIPYAAAFVAQSFPYATTTLMMTEGQVIPSYIELKNTGSKAWDTNTKIGTTVARDRASVFADGTWLAPNRPAHVVSGTVPPGGTYKFTFDLRAPNQTGLFDEHFGVVEEGVAWFSDPGQGGPADNQLEVKIQVNAGASSSSGASSSGSTSSGASSSGASSSGSASSGSSSGSGGAAGTGGSGAGGSGNGTGGSTSSGTTSHPGSNGGPGQTSGCAVARSGPTEPSKMWVIGLVLAAAGIARRRSLAGSGPVSCQHVRRQPVA